MCKVQMKTVAENEAMSDEEKLAATKAAKMGSWYDGWRPYCLKCNTFARMSSMSYGFKCLSCGNMIGFDCTRLQESPLNV